MGHGAVRLTDGRALVAGGWVGGNCVSADSERFDPATARRSPWAGASPPSIAVADGHSRRDRPASAPISTGGALMDDPGRESAEGRVGQTLRGKWRLDRVIGVGGMAAVYEATHRNGKRVAVKMLHPSVSHDAEVRRRFLREGYVANSVGHPGAVIVDDVTDDGRAFLVMELCDGGPIDGRMRARWRRRSGTRRPRSQRTPEGRGRRPDGGDAPVDQRGRHPPCGSRAARAGDDRAARVRGGFGADPARPARADGDRGRPPRRRRGDRGRHAAQGRSWRRDGDRSRRGDDRRAPPLDAVRGARCDRCHRVDRDRASRSERRAAPVDVPRGLGPGRSGRVGRREATSGHRTLPRRRASASIDGLMSVAAVADRSRGRWTLNVVPLPCCLAVKKGSKMRARVCSSRPQPVSETASCTYDPGCTAMWRAAYSSSISTLDVSIVSLPPSGMASRALTTRFVSNGSIWLEERGVDRLRAQHDGRALRRPTHELAVWTC